MRFEWGPCESPNKWLSQCSVRSWRPLSFRDRRAPDWQEVRDVGLKTPASEYKILQLVPPVSRALVRTLYGARLTVRGPVAWTDGRHSQMERLVGTGAARIRRIRLHGAGRTMRSSQKAP